MAKCESLPPRAETTATVDFGSEFARAGSRESTKNTLGPDSESKGFDSKSRKTKNSPWATQTETVSQPEPESVSVKNGETRRRGQRISASVPLPERIPPERVSKGKSAFESRTETQRPASRRKSKRSGIPDTARPFEFFPSGNRPAESDAESQSFRLSDARSGLSNFETSKKASEFPERRIFANRANAAFHSDEDFGTYPAFFDTGTFPLRADSQEEARKFVSKTTGYHSETRPSAQEGIRPSDEIGPIGTTFPVAWAMADSNTRSIRVSKSSRTASERVRSFDATAPRFQ